MRIISGQWRGRRLKAPPGSTTRPTADRTREGLFSMLTSRLGSFDELRVLDLFAGSGALGLEALSRGAEHCCFVEQDRAALDALRANISLLEAGQRADVRATSVFALGPVKQPYDLILMDPPYDSGAGGVALDKLARLGWIGPASWISLETGRGEKAECKGYEIETSRTFGRAQIHIMRRAEL